MAQSQFNTTLRDIGTAYRTTPLIEDIVDGVYTVGSPQSILADTEYRLDFDDENLARHSQHGFNEQTGVTAMYDFDNDVAVYDELHNTQVIVAFPNCLFKPSSAAAGECLIRMYVNETSPILHDQAIVGFKGTDYEKMGDLFSYYTGEETGYDLKNKGVYFTFECSLAGTMYSKSLLHYLT